MPIRAVVFDIGGVLEITEPGSLILGWAPRLGLTAGELESRLAGRAAGPGSSATASSGPGTGSSSVTASAT